MVTKAKPAAKKAAAKPKEVKPPKNKPLKIPAAIGSAADLYFTLIEQRLALQRQAEQIKEQEKLVQEHLINKMPKSNTTGVAGKLCRVTAVTKVVPQVKDWDKFYEHVAKNRTKGGFALMNRAVNAKAIKELWEAGKEVPGIGSFNAVTLSLNKL